MGPLEHEIDRIMQRRLLADPTLDGLLSGRLSDADMVALGARSGEKFAQLMLLLYSAQSEIIKRLAQEIDALRATADGGDDEPDPR